MYVGNVELRDYQAATVAQFLTVPSCLIAYGKRVGKTITALALVETLRSQGETGPILIIGNHDSPFTRDFAEIGLDPERLHLVDRPSRKQWHALLDAGPLDGHYYQIHWAGLAPEFLKGTIQRIKWSAIIADEAHHASGRNSQRTKALKKLRTRYKIGLTADPSDEKPQKIWSLLNWLYPSRYRSFWRWVREYVEVFEQNGRHGAYLVFGKPINVEKFQEEISEFYVTMSLEEIDPGQVPHIFEDIEVDMSPIQAEAYEQFVEWQMAQLDDDLVMVEWPMVADMRLQQLAQSMGKVEKRLVWKTKTELDPATGKKVGKRKQVEVTTVRQIEPSTKLDALMQALTTRDDLGPTIVFTQYPDMAHLAMERLSTAGIKYTSALANTEVNDAMWRFQSGQVDVLVGSKAISESIELNRADTIIMLDIPWNPRVYGQILGRAQAVGKRTPIRVIHIKTRGTVDCVRIDRVMEKQAWIDLLLGREHHTVK